MSDSQQQLEGGAYEVIRGRLEKWGGVLQERLSALNTEREEVFGAVATSLLSTERVSTEHNCTPRDLIAIGKNRFIFGYNIQFGLKSTTEMEDVFGVYDFDPETHEFSAVPLEEVLGNSAFNDDFHYLYKYYRQAVFVKFMVIGPHLYMAMRIGKEISDLKTFKWLRKGDGKLEYVGNRFDHEYKFPPQQEFEWKRANRDMQRAGEHPHISIEDRVFVETVGGDLTIKIEDNTSSGEGIYAEDVAEPDQTLDDAEIFYAIVGPLILLKILPYREEKHRYLVFNEKTKTVHRIDAIGQSCVLLPDEHGLIFSNGYLLLTGEAKIFDTALSDMRFEHRVASANGEDTLFVFYNRKSGDYVLLSYNLITQMVETPVLCSGYSLFPDGLMIYFRTEEAAQKFHALQVWQTPILSEEVALEQKAGTDSFLAKIGSAQLVRGMAECREIQALLRKDDSYGGLYLDLTKKTSDMLDGYFWLAKEETKNLAEPLRELKQAAGAAIDEFEKVRALRASTAEQSEKAKAAVATLLKEVRVAPTDDIFAFVKQLGELRRRRGEVIGLRELRYVDEDFVTGLEDQLKNATAEVSEKTVTFLLSEGALDPYRKKVEAQGAVVPELAKVTEADEVGEALDAAGADLEMLIEVVGNLKIEDATETTQIIDSVSAIYSTLNGVRAELKNKRKDLARGEGEAQFGAQIKLLGQSVVNYLDLCDTPEKAEEYLSKVMVQLEEMEGRFAEFDEYIEELTTKREEIYQAFEGRKQSLLEKKNRRASALQKSADRVLSGVKNRLETFSEINEINGYFAGDLMIEKVRDVISELTELGDSVKAGDIRTKLKTLRDDAVRSLKDRKELFVDGKEVLRFGRHQFAVNTQTLALSLVPREGRMCYHLSGTDFFEPVRDEAFLATKQVWSQEVVSENDEVYRAEWLAYQLLKSPDFMARWPEVDLAEEVRKFMQARYAEGYVKGVHDGDAEKILAKVAPLQAEAGLLKFGPGTRAAALLFWETWAGEEKERLKSRLEAHAERRKIFGAGGETRLRAELESAMDGKKAEAAYLFAELTDGDDFVVSAEAARIVKNFRQELTGKQAGKNFAAALERFSDSLSGRLEVARDWMEATLDGELSLREDYLQEAAFWLARGGFEERWVSSLALETEVADLKGSHGRIEDGGMTLHFNEFLERLGRFEREQVPVFQAYQKLKGDLIEQKKEAMRLSEFEPRVMSSFVRNRLINEVYLPMIGDNLAKQMGTAGDDTRTDRMGLLLLVSPPGYGKTTLMEYVGNRLGLTFMKINGPALGHDVTSLDPKQAPNASAAEEVEKLNLALEMGDNVMIYLDDIQHTHSEFLQKFISLCDGQRKIEGVYQGKAKTYDLRGKKVAVVMAGNPYTETGGKFQIPDMLANRADTYNLGDILGGHEEAFKASYIENCLTSSPALSKLASRSQKDVYAVMEMAKTGSPEGIVFEGNYTPAEVQEMRRTMVHLYRVRDSILRVNLQYIRSAAQEDNYRTEPAFRLQGSYRNMNRIAEKVLPLMSDDEVEQLIFSHYENESQTLTSGAEANLLKFKELENALSEKEAARWEEIKKEFNKRKLLGGAGENDPVARVVAQLSQFNEGLEGIGRSLGENSGKLSADTVSELRNIIADLRAVPVEISVLVDDEEGGIDIRKVQKRERED